jgi:hypothetical protein
MPRTSQALFGIGLIAIGACLGANLGTLDTTSSARAEEAQKAEPLDVRYAQLFLRQSQLDLQRALDVVEESLAFVAESHPLEA